MVRDIVIKQGFGKLHNKFHKSLYYMTRSDRFLLSNDEKPGRENDLFQCGIKYKQETTSRPISRVSYKENCNCSNVSLETSDIM